MTKLKKKNIQFFLEKKSSQLGLIPQTYDLIHKNEIIP